VDPTAPMETLYEIDSLDERRIRSSFGPTKILGTVDTEGHLEKIEMNFGAVARTKVQLATGGGPTTHSTAPGPIASARPRRARSPTVGDPPRHSVRRWRAGVGASGRGSSEAPGRDRKDRWRRPRSDAGFGLPWADGDPENVAGEDRRQHRRDRDDPRSARCP